MANTRSLTHCLYLALVRPRLMASSTTLSFLLSSPKLKSLGKTIFNSSSSSSLSFSTTSTRYPLQYEMIISHPTQSSLAQNRRRPARGTKPNSDNSPETEESLGTELGFESWVDKKLSSDKETARPGSENLEPPQMDKAKRKYYNKRRKRMYGTDSDEDGKRDEDGFVELEPEVVDFPRLFPREEELFFYDTFAYPWEKEKHYKMVYQLEKKYFPDQCLDKAFLEPGESNEKNGQGKVKTKKKGVDKKDGDSDVMESKGLVFFDEGRDTKGKGETLSIVSTDITEKKVEEFFKCLKKVPNEGSEVAIAEPYFVSRSTKLPPTWDGPHGTVLLVNKPKGWTSFTVCGKLRRLVNVKKVGHAGTLDPMATGLLIVCIGKATKLVDSYQGMTKGYSGVFRLGEATSTWDADSPVIQREPWEHVKDVDIRKTAASFIGEIWQVPPMFSAIKVGGEKMYEKARRGENIELSPRRISIFQFDIERSLEDRQNLVFRVTCSKGTYIRSLCADFGKALGSCAHLTALRRDSIGEYSADDAWDFKELEESIPKSYL